ncbi:plastid division protein PDV1-like [Oryza brachyantha]|uniref:Plastid division protein PDV1 n=1 Tax=Oryza brachyantha TaxID=4533 RepID=J3KXU6_ORYBR|nr:plastid division protein PDV1-like [Oryza brachyantha]
MEPEEAEAVLETIWDLHDKVSDAIHALSRASFLRTVRRRAGDKPAAGPVRVKGGDVGSGDEAAALDAVAEEARSLHAIRAALEDLEDQFECFLAVQSQQQAERDISLARLEQSRIMLAIRLNGHRGVNQKIIGEALDFVRNVCHGLWPSLSVNKPDKLRSHSGADNSCDSQKGSNFLVQVVASSFALAKNSFNFKTFGSLLGQSAVLVVGMTTLLQSHWLSSGQQGPSVGKYSYKMINQEYSPRLETCLDARINHLDVFLAKG